MTNFSGRRSLLTGLAALALLGAGGCDEFGLLENLNQDPSIQLAADNGSLPTGDTIDLWIDYEENPPDRVTARLEQDNRTFQELEIVSPVNGWENQTGALGGIVVPVLIPEGRYTLVTEAWSGEKLLTQQRMDSYIIHGAWKIRGVDLFPPQAVPGGLFFAHVSLDMPELSDPWLRWLREDELVGQGPLSEGWNEVILKAGESPGIASLAVELHLGEPDIDDSPIQYFQTELYTVAALPPDVDTLGPPESYSVLLHFDGTLGQEPRPEIIGKPKPVVIGNYSGFRFTDGSGLFWDNLTAVEVPFGTGDPFSLNLGLVLYSGEHGRILRIDDGESFAMSLSRTAEDELFLNLNEDPRYTSIFQLPVSGGIPANITISFEPAGFGVTLLWKIDGDTFHTDYWESVPAVFGDHFSATLGADGGFSGIITEFGIHVRDEKGAPASEGDRFTFYRDADDSLLISEGFEDESVSSDIEFEEPVHAGNGTLIMPPDTSLRFPSGGGGELSIRKLPPGDTADLLRLDPVTGEVRDSVSIDSNYYSNSPYRISISLEKTEPMSDNGNEVIYELRTSSQNESDLQLEHILVSRE